MAVTISVSDVMVYVKTLIKNQRLNINNQQPGVTMANIVLQRMLNPPFVWRENRTNISQAITTGGGTDYVMSIANLGRIESQWMQDPQDNRIALEGAVSLPKISTVRPPIKVAPVYDDNEGNITMRFDSVPDQNYTAFFDYQRKAPLITSSAGTFGPMPDEFEYLFAIGMLAQGALIVNDARFNIWQGEFVAGLLATQDGLDAQAKSLFYNQMLNTGRTAQRVQAMGAGADRGRMV